MKKRWIAVPVGYKYDSLERANFEELSHPRIPKNRSVEYLNHLTDIFEQLPKSSDIEKTVAGSKLYVLRNDDDINAAVRHDLDLAPEIVKNLLHDSQVRVVFSFDTCYLSHC